MSPRNQLNKNTATKSILPKLYEIHAPTNTFQLSMEELLANGKPKRSIVTLLVKYFQSYFKDREISYVLPRNYKTLPKH